MDHVSNSWKSWIRASAQASTGLGLLLIAVLWATLAFHTEEERYQVRTAWTRNMGNLARAFEEHTLRAIREADKILLLLRTAYETNPEEFNLRQFTANRDFLHDLTLQLAIIGPDGYLASTNVGGSTARLDLSDREHFRVHRDGRDDMLFVSKPVLGRASGKWSIQLTRRLRTQDGGFAGVIVASLDPAAFTTFYDAIDIGHGGVIAIVGHDGIVRAHGGPVGELGMSLKAHPVLSAAMAAPAGTLTSRGLGDDHDRLVSFRAVPGQPLFVLLAVPEATLTDFTDDKQKRLKLFAGIGTLLVLVAMAISIRNRRRLELTRQDLARSQANTAMKSHELEATLANMSQGIMMVDSHRRIAVINRRAVELLGLPEEFLHGRPSFDALLTWQWEHGEFQADATDAEVLRFIRTGGISTSSQVYERRRPDGTVLEVRSIPLAEGGMVRTFTDVTERVRGQEALAAARDAAEAASRTRTAFLAMMSHEMRTPLNGVIGMASLLLDTGLDDEQTRYVATMRRSADHLLQIIEDVLDLSKLEAGRATREDIAFDIREVADEVVGMVAPSARDKGLFLAATVEPDVPRGLRGDPAALRQVLLNLVGNGVKFTTAGFVRLSISCRTPVEAEAVSVTIKVQDSGIGIPADKLPLLFEDFQQVDASISRRFGGTGLGLAISRRIIEQIGGRIDVESIAEVGSTFQIKLSLPMAAQPVTARRLADKTVLVLSPSSMMIAALSTTLADEGARVTATTDPAAALAMTAELRPDVVIVEDAVLRRRPALLAELRALGTPAPRIIGLTTCLVSGRPAGQAGESFNSQIGWPASGAAIADAVLAKSARAADHARRSQNVRSLDILLAEDNETNLMVIAAMLDRLGHRVQCVRDGRQALEAVQQAHFDLILMDIAMPELDGYAATKAIRALPGPKGLIPIAALTANALTEDVAAARDAGMNEFATKPITTAKLEALLARLAHPLCPCAAAPAMVKDETAPAFDAAIFEAFRRDIGWSGAHGIAETFLRDAHERLEAMTSLADDETGLARNAHALKSAAATLGLTLLSCRAGALERECSGLAPADRSLAVKALREAFEQGSEHLLGCLEAMTDEENGLP